jgi:hypothetical protein
MALGAAILLAAPHAVYADDAADWKPIHTSVQVYFVAKADFGAYEQMQAWKNKGPIKLFVEEREAGKDPKKVPSEASISCKSGTALNKKTGTKVATWHCRIASTASNGAAYSVPVRITKEQKPIPAAVQQAGEARPAEVSQGVWAAVVNSGKVPQAQWARAALAVEKALKQAPHGDAMRAGGNAKMNKLLVQVAADIAAGQDDAAVVTRAIDLSENLAAPGGTTKPVVPATVKAGTGTGTSQGGPDGRAATSEADGTNILNALALLLEKPEVQQDMAKRLVAFLTKPTGAEAYVDAKGHEDAAAKQLEKGISEGIPKVASTVEGRGKAAVLYFMLGEDAPKPWFKDHPELDPMVREQAMRGYFKEAMKVWTVAGAGTPGVANAGPYKGDAAWPEQLITDALKKAEQVWKDPRVKGKIKLNIDQNDQGLPVVGDIGRGKLGNTDLSGMTAAGFDSAQTWEHGAVVKMMQIPGSKPPAFRKIAMKMVAQTTDWGPPAVVENRLSVVDISEASPDGGKTPDNFFGKYFRVGSQVSNTFPMDATNTKSLMYSIDMKGGKVSLSINGPDGKPAGEAFETSIADIYAKRQEQLNNPRDSFVSEINGQKYRVIPQGGAHNGLAFYPADDSGKADGANPAMMVDLTERGANNGPVNLKGDRPLGFIGKTEDGTGDQFWVLRWNPDTKTYEPVRGTKPTDPIFDPLAKPPAPKTDPAKPGDKPAGTDDGNTADNGDGTTGDGTTTDGTTTPDTETSDATVPATGISACQYDKKFDPGSGNGSLFERYRVQDGWKMFTDGKQNPSDTNKSYLCLYKNQGIWLDGLIPNDKSALHLEGGQSDGYLVVTVIKPGSADADGPEKGQALIAPSESANVKVNGDQVTYGKDKARSLNSSLQYYIPLKGLKDNIKKSSNLATASKVAWVQLYKDYMQGNQNPTMTVYLRPGDDFKAVLTKAVNDFGGKDTLCKNGDSITAPVAAFIDGAVKDPDFKKAIGEVNMTNINLNPPSVVFSCLAQATGTQGVWNVAVASWADASKNLVAREGKIDPKSGYSK